MKLRSETPEELKTLLEPIVNLELEEVSLSESDISDVFEEFHLQSFLHCAKGEKPISKPEADRLTVAHFTDEFKQTMSNVRKELNLGCNMMYETVEDVQKIFTEKRKGAELSNSALERIETLLKDEEYIYSSSEVSDEFDSISDIWKTVRLCDENEKITMDALQINDFHENESFKLDRPVVSWKILDISRCKCEQWLNEQNKI